MRTFLSLILTTWSAHAQLSVTVLPVKLTGQKAIVSLTMKNDSSEKIESARAVVFLLDEQGKIVTQPTTRWVIGGNNTSGLTAGATNTFHFVITSDKPITTTNLTTKVTFSRIVLEGGRVGDVSRDVQIKSDGK